MRSATSRGMILIFLIASCHLTRALDPHRPLRQYGHQTWQSNDGLPQNSIHSILQTRDGYLWFATEDGLVRFNSIDFTIFNSENTPEFKSNAIRSLMEDRSGNLWISTAEGLVRYGEGRFTAFFVREGLPSDTVWFIHQGRSGQLVAATGAGLATFVENRWQPIPATGSLSVASEERFAEMGSGALCMASGAELLCLDSQSLQPVLKLQTPDKSEISALHSDRGGQLWAGTKAGLLLLNQAKLTPVSVLSGNTQASVTSMAVAADGALWVGTSRGLARKTGEKFILLDQHSGLPGERIDRLFADREGALWVGTSRGVARVFYDNSEHDSSEHDSSGREKSAHHPFAQQRSGAEAGRAESFPSINSLSASNLLAAFEDREGNQWLGTESEGATVLRDQKFTTYTTDDGLAGNVVRSLAQAANGEVWIGTDGAGLNRENSGAAPGSATSFAAITTHDGLSSNVILSIAPAPNGDLWVGTPTGLNLIRGEKIRLFTSSDGLADDYIRSLYVDGDGSLWVGTTHGLSHRQGDTTRNYTAMDGLGSDYIGAMIRSRNGDLWICTSAGLTRMRGGQFKNFSIGGEFPGDVATTLYEDGAGTLWLGTNEGGLRRMRNDGSGSIEAVQDRERMLPSSVFGILEDTAGDLWLSSKSGIFRVRKDYLDHAPTGEDTRILQVSGHEGSDGSNGSNGSNGVGVRAYGTADGMRVRECSSGGHPAVWRMRDGSLWFATLRGVAITDPQARDKASAPPLPAVEEVLVDDQRRNPQAALAIAPGNHRIEFRYTGLSFAAPLKVHYRYKLEGFDSSWVDAGNRRTAFYTNLPPGHYTFRVMAADQNGVRGDGARSLALNIKPYFRQTLWFWLALAVAGLLLIGLLYRWRLRRVESTFSAVLGERNRIAREIHDTLAQGIVSISLQLEVVSRLLGTSTEAARLQLDQTRSLVRQSLADARSSIWELRGQGNDAADLPARLGSALQKIEAPPGTPIRLQVTGTYRAVGTRIENELLRIAQEAVTNAVRHADARRIDVLLAYDEITVSLLVRDDGHGFNSDHQNVTMTGHFGIQGMKERAEAIDGAFGIDTDTAGTLVRVKVHL